MNNTLQDTKKKRKATQPHDKTTTTRINATVHKSNTNDKHG